MPRYHFHIDHGEFVPDPVGTDLPDLKAARIEAVRAAGEMINEMGESFWEHQRQWNMHVTDSDDRLLFSLQFSAKVTSGIAWDAPERAGDDSVDGRSPEAHRG